MKTFIKILFIGNFSEKSVSGNKHKAYIDVSKAIKMIILSKKEPEVNLEALVQKKNKQFETI